MLWLVAFICLTPVVSSFAQSNPEAAQHSSTGAALMSALLALTADADSPAEVSVLRFPEDHQAHLDYPAEIWQLLAFLRSKAGHQYIASLRFVRVSLGAKAVESARQSAWRYSQVMLFSASVFNVAERTTQREMSSSRVALDLAGTDSLAGRIWVNQQALEIATNGNCELEAKISGSVAAEALQLVFKQRGCPSPAPVDTASMIAGFSQAMELQSGRLGDLAFDTGEAWLLRSWGSLPVGASPVVLDSFLLQLPQTGLLQLIRSRRQDGSGVPVVTSILHQQEQQKMIDYRLVELTDTASWHSIESSKTYSAAWNLTWPGHVASIKPLASAQELSVLAQRQWSGAITAEIHNGQGTEIVLGIADLSPITEPTAP